MTPINNKRRGISLLVVASLIVVLVASQRPDYKSGSGMPYALQKPKSTTAQNPDTGTTTHPMTSNHRMSNRLVKVSQLQSNSRAKIVDYLSNQQSGIIGLYDRKQIDNPADNIFTVKMDNIPAGNDRVWLTYKLTGVEDYSNIACSINDRLAMGGYLAKKSNGTNRQRVQLDPAWLQKGENRIQFGLPENADYGYRVEDLVIEVEKGTNDAPLAVNAGTSLYNGKAYIHGFVQNAKGDKATVSIDGKTVNLRDGEFETIVEHAPGKPVEVKAVVSGKPYVKEINFTNNTSPDKEFALNEKCQKAIKSLEKGKADSLEIANVSLKVDEKSLLTNQTLSVTSLRDMDLPALDMGMYNVTDKNKGVRFLPHGEHFSQPATVSLKYDRTKIPDGYTENDIKTFYFDTRTNHWVALERDTVDKATCSVISKTTHFTDMINGVIKTPESPETQGFTPTMMNDIKAADPTSKIELIAPPTANNQGSANLNYSLEMPPARNGMSPNLAISYNSDGGSGWLGEGWDLNVPSITVDTRFGVPLYDPKRETETYNFNGEMLARAFVTGSGTNDDIDEKMFFPDRGVVYLRNTGNNNTYQFFPRIEGVFPRIVRTGVSPDKYSWVATDKNGTKYYYGNLNADSAVLKNPVSGNIAEWKLRAMVNIHGDSLNYSYRTTTETVYSRLSASTIYLNKIEGYTYDYLSNKYKRHTQVLFYSNTKKNKKTNNARYGFITMNNMLLDSVLVNYDSTGYSNQLRKLHKYTFAYKPGVFNEVLLDRISQQDNAGNEIASQTMGYYNTVANSAYYDASVTQSPAPWVEKDILKVGESSVFGNVKTTSKSASLYVGLGLGDPTSVSGSVGLNSSYSKAQTIGESTLMDINGDGLADKVYYVNGQLTFCPQYPTGTFDNANARTIVGAPSAFIETQKENFSLGVEGAVSSFSGRIDKDLLAKSVTTAYTSDVNGDGLVDIIYHGNVYFNYISGYMNGIAIPAFTQNSLMTDNPMTNKTIYNTEPAAMGIMDYSHMSEDSLRSEASPMQDVVRVWEAPYTGYITIDGAVKLLPPTGNYDTLAYSKADGVVVSIQIDDKLKWRWKINRGEIDPVLPFTSYNSEYGFYEVDNWGKYVTKGQRIYFRVQCGDSLLSNDYFDNVLWNPTITYIYNSNYESFDIQGDGKDANGYSYTVFPSSEGLVNKSGYNQIDSGVPVTIQSHFVKPITVDDVTLTIYASSKVNSSPVNVDYTKSVFEKTYSTKAAICDTLIPLLDNTYKYFWFVLSSNTNNVRWDQVKWEPEIRYSYQTSDNVTRNRVDKVGVNYDIYFDQQVENSDISKQILTVPSTGDYFAMPVILDRNMYSQYGCGDRSAGNTLAGLTVVLTDVETGEVVLKKKDIAFKDDPYNGTPVFWMGQNDTYSERQRLRGHKFKVDIFSNSTSKLSNHSYGVVLYKFDDGDFNCTTVEYVSKTTPTMYSKYNKDKNQEFGLMWRNWGQFEYNAAQGRYHDSIQVDKLKLPSDSDNISLGDMRLITLAPDFKTKKFWQGYSENIKLNGDTIVPARLLMDNVVDIKSFVSVSGPSRVSRPGINYQVTNNSVLEKAAIQKSDNPLYHIQAPNIENKEPNQLSVSLSVKGNIPVKFLNKIGVKLDAGANGTYALSKYEKLLDYMDMNGDGYPDYFNKGRILYSNSRGTVTEKYLDSEMEHSESQTASLGVSAGANRNIYKSATTDSKKSAFEAAASISLSAGITKTTTDLKVSYIDINGDGLPDKIDHDKNEVSINLGYGFSASGTLTTFKNDESNFSANAGAGFGIERDDSYELGTGIASTYSTKSNKLVDINGDGLIDIVEQGTIGNWTDFSNLWNNITQKNLVVHLNTGDGFESNARDWQTGVMGESSLSKCKSLNAALTFGIPILGTKIVFRPSAQSGTTNAYQLTDIRDYNGDGISDLLSTSSGSNDMEIRYSKITYTNKLQSVTNSLGGKFSLSYKRSTPSSDHPNGKWVMESVTVDDGISDDGKSMKTAFDYNNGKYDRRERQFRGFGEVVTKSLNSDNGDAVYRKTIQKFDVSNYYTKNNLLKTTVTDGNNQVLQETENKYYCYDVKTFRTVNGAIFLDPYTFNDFVLSDSVVAYSPLKYTQSAIYDGPSNKMVSNQSFYTYNIDRAELIKKDLYQYGFGELKSYKFSDKGTLDSLGNGTYNYQTTIKYRPLEANDKFVTGLPVEVTVSDASKTYRHIKAYYGEKEYPNHLTRVVHSLNEQGDSAIAILKYDKAGNIIKKVLPSKMTYNYTYDDRYKMYVTQVTDTFGYTSKLENYDYRFGVPRKTTDINGNVMTTTLDNLGRVTSIKGPNDPVYTLKFEYHPQITTDANGITSPAYAVTKHYDPTHSDDSLETVTFVDGMGRPVQVKKEGYVDSQPVMIVSGRAKYDAFGRVNQAYYPVTEPMSNKLTFNRTFDNVAPIRTTYDVLDRVLSVTDPKGDTTSTAYSINNGLLKTIVTDAEGHSQATFANGSGQTLRTEQYHNSDTIATTFEYDPVNQLHVVNDAKGGKTISEYDMAGRRTQVTHPASGTTKFYYDAAGNLTGKQTANLLLTRDTIIYKYDYNRLKSISYPKHPENNVTYTYGAAGAESNRAGRLVNQIDGSGSQEFKYGKMGEITEVKRTLVIPNQAVATYTTNWTYDSWNRVLSMTYPDGEVLNYSYNTGGLLNKLTGSKENVSYDYVSNITYDKFEQRASMQYGNGAITTYTYKPDTRQLDNLKVKVGSTNLMDNTYSYDAVSNVTRVENKGTAMATTGGNGIGGAMMHNYYYDDLYRLKTADGTFAGYNGKTANYTLAMGYDNLHNITRKSQHISQSNVQFNGLLQAGYDLGYSYAYNPQQISNIADTSYRAEGTIKTPVVKVQQFAYDANGNLLSINTGAKATDGKLRLDNSRRLLWDENNYMLASCDNGFVTNYFYDAAGERTVKMSGENEGVQVNGVLSAGRTGTTNFTAYVSPYLVVNNGGNYTKHIYIGSQRITSKVGNSGLFTTSPVNTTDLQTKYATLTAKIKERFDSLGITYKGTQQTGGLVSTNPSTATSSYFYHSDHLGSSSLITDPSGAIVQHLEYVPFGETFIDERLSQSSWNTPYLFSGKERDNETGLLYFGARYQDSKYGIWYSVDPLAEKYPGVSSYVYCLDNPVKFIDPDGRKVTNPGNYVLSNKGLISKLKNFDAAVARLSGKNTNLFIIKITGGDRYKKNGKIYSVTNDAQIKKSATHSRHLQSEGAVGVDLATKDIDRDVLEKAAKESGFRIDPSGKYNDGHFHLDVIDPKCKKEYLDDKNKDTKNIPSDSEFTYSSNTPMLLDIGKGKSLLETINDFFTRKNLPESESKNSAKSNSNSKTKQP